MGIAATSPGKDALRTLYRRRAPRYGLTANLYYLIGFREQAYRKLAVAALGLRPGDTVLSTFALTLVPEFEAVIARAAEALVPGRRLVVLDLKRPAWAPRWLVRLGVWLTSPFGVREEYVARHPWKAVRRCFAHADVTELYGGFAYLAVGEKA